MNRYQTRAAASAVAGVALATATFHGVQAQPAQTVQQCQAAWEGTMQSGMTALRQTIGAQEQIGAKLDANNCRDPGQARTMGCLQLTEASLLAMGNIKIASDLLGFSIMARDHCPQAVADAAAKVRTCAALGSAYASFKSAAEVSWAPASWFSGGEDLAAMKKVRNQMIALGCPDIP